MSLIIRRARAEDALSIATVHVGSWRTTYAGIVPGDYIASLQVKDSAAGWASRLEPGGPTIFVAENARGVFGLICGGPIREPLQSFDAELQAIYLLKPRQGQGTGRRLVSELADHLLSAGMASLLVWVLEQNPAVGFYQQLGGVEVARSTVAIGGVDLPELAFGWRDLRRLRTPD